MESRVDAETFAEMHDKRVGKLLADGVPDWKANIPTMPGTYRDAFVYEGAISLHQLEANLAKLGNFHTYDGWQAQR